MTYIHPEIAIRQTNDGLGTAVITADGAAITHPMTLARADKMMALPRVEFFDELQTTYWDGLLTYRLQYVLRRVKEGDPDVEPYQGVQEIIEDAPLLMAAMDEAGIKYKIREKT